MAPYINIDPLHCVGETITCRATLAAFGQVSKSWNSVCTPYLYRQYTHRISSGFRVAEFLTSPEESHLSLTEELTLGRDMMPSNEEKSEQHRPEQHRIRLCSDILGKCLGEMSNLTSLTCVLLYYSSSSPTSLPV